MAEKLLVLASMVISQGKGLIKYYNDDGAIVTVKSKEAQIVDEMPEPEPTPELEGYENPDFSDEDPEIEPSDDEDSQNENFRSTFQSEQELDEAEAGHEVPADAQTESQQEEDCLPATPVVNSRGKVNKNSRIQTVKAQPKTPAKAVKKAAPAKVAAKPAAAPKKTNGNGHTAPNTIRTIAGREHDVSGYTKTRNASGAVSLDNGDSTAEKLREKSLDQVYDIVAKALKEDVKALRAKYKHLNAGMQRMTLGNRMRKVVRAKESSASA